MKERKDLWKSRLETFDDALIRISKRKQESIKKSMLRPLHQEVLRCFFIVFAMFLDTFFPFQVLLDTPKPFSFIISAVILIIILYGEVKLYTSIWGKNGYWSIKKYRKKTKKKMNI